LRSKNGNVTVFAGLKSKVGPINEMSAKFHCKIERVAAGVAEMHGKRHRWNIRKRITSLIKATVVFTPAAIDILKLRI